MMLNPVTLLNSVDPNQMARIHTIFLAAYESVVCVMNEIK